VKTAQWAGRTCATAPASGCTWTWTCSTRRDAGGGRARSGRHRPSRAELLLRGLVGSADCLGVEVTVFDRTSTRRAYAGSSWRRSSPASAR
jgi:hypothetical protein